MTLLRKYYELILDLPTGGGIPDEVRVEIKKIADRQFQILWDEGDIVSINTSDALFECGERSYSLASEELARLKEENERLRGALSELYDVVYKGENVFKSLDKAHEVLNKPNITIVQSTPSPTKK